MIPFYLGLGLPLTAALFFLASMSVPALVCCGTGALVMAYELGKGIDNG